MFGIGTPCSSEKVQRFGGTYHLHFQGQSFLSAFANFLIGSLFSPQNGRGMFLQNFEVSPNYMALQPRKLYSSNTRKPPYYALILSALGKKSIENLKHVIRMIE
jgi:hypothetical protein